MMYRIILSIEFLEVLLEFHGHLFICVCGGGVHVCVWNDLCASAKHASHECVRGATFKDV